MQQCLNKLTRLLALPLCERLAGLPSQQNLQQPGEMELKFLVVGVGGHERANDGHESGLCGHQGVELCLELVFVHQTARFG